MEITVTERHKTEGKRQSCAWCPVALAVRDQYGLAEEDVTVVENGRMWARDQNGRIRMYRLPREARDWIAIFDHGSEEERAALGPITFRARRQ